MSYTIEQIKNTIVKKGYVWFNDDLNKSFDVNIVGIRNETTGDKVTVSPVSKLDTLTFIVKFQ